MNDKKTTRSFEYRRPRVNAGFSVEFISGNGPVQGFCQDVNEAGIRAVFDGSVQPNSNGLLILRHPVGVLELNAIVAYIENNMVGLTFHFQTPLEQTMTSEFIANILDHHGLPVVVRMP